MTGHSSHDDAAGLERVTASLRRLPAVDPNAAHRIVTAALHRRRAERRRRVWLAAAAGVALTAGVGAGGSMLYRRPAPLAVAESSAPAPAPGVAPAAATPVAPRVAPAGARFATAGASRDEAPVSVPFVLRRPGAHRVALVGDFDDWSPTAYPMVRGEGGTWTITVDMTPGRHAYAFVIDDTVWVTDPRADVVRDPDYGRDHSVVVVGQP